MRPTFDRAAFARDVKRWLAINNLHHRSAARLFDTLNTAMLSRAVNARKMTVESVLALCEAAELDPFDYTKSQKKQTDTENDKRETCGFRGSSRHV